MADKPFEELLTCSICLDQYKDPKILPCHHSFCRECLEKTPLELEQGKYILMCPTCRKPAQLPDGGVLAFSSSFLINNLIDLHQSKERSKTHHEDLTMCDEHGKPEDIFCEECGVVICHVCAIRSHRSHAYNLINDCYDKYHIPITDALNRVRLKIDEIKLASKTLDKADNEILEQEHNVKGAINLTADELIFSINQHRENLLAEARVNTERKQAMIDMQRDKASKMLKNLQSCEESVELLLQAGSKKHILESAVQAAVKLDLACAFVDLKCLEPAEQPDMEYRPESIDIEQLGEIRASYINDSFQAVNKTVVATRGQRVGIQIKQMLKKGVKFRPSPEMFSIQLLNQNTSYASEDLFHETQVNDECTYTLYFTPNTSGSYWLIVMVGGHPILGSPLNCHVLLALKPERLIRGIFSPHSIAVMKDGAIVATETANNSVQVFHSNGERRSFTCPNPKGIASTLDGTILVASGELVKNFCIHGNLIADSRFQKRGFLKDNSNTCDNPHSLATHENKVHITDMVNGRVHIANLDLTQCTKLKGPDHLWIRPNGVAVNSSGSLFITCGWNNSFTKINLSSGKVSTFGSKGSGKGQLKHPTGIAVDKSNFVYIADTDNHRISIFTSDGQFLTCFGKKGRTLEEMNKPCGVAIDNNENFYICDTGNNRIVVYE